MKQLNFKVPYPVQPFSETDSFADSRTYNEAHNDKTLNGGIIDQILQTAKYTKDMIVDESKVIAPDVIETFKGSRERLNKEQRIIKLIPNHLLFYGIVAIGIYAIVKSI